MAAPSSPPCPCGSTRPYDACCQPLHQGTAAASAEALMRSRYSAYVLGLEDYLLATWHVNTRPTALDLKAEPRAKWLRLEVKRHEPLGNDEARVEFIARYKVGGRAHRLHETSRFQRIDGRWYYLDGQFPDR